MVRKHRQYGLLNGVVFIDLTKAFDTTDHEIILSQRSYLGVDQAAIKSFLSYCLTVVAELKDVISVATIKCSYLQLRGAVGQHIGFLLFNLHYALPTPCWTLYQECLLMKPILRYPLRR